MSIISDTKPTKSGLIILIVLMTLSALVIGSTFYCLIQLGDRAYHKEFKK